MTQSTTGRGLRFATQRGIRASPSQIRVPDEATCTAVVRNTSACRPRHIRIPHAVFPCGASRPCHLLLKNQHRSWGPRPPGRCAFRAAGRPQQDQRKKGGLPCSQGHHSCPSRRGSYWPPPCRCRLKPRPRALRSRRRRASRTSSSLRRVCRRTCKARPSPSLP